MLASVYESRRRRNRISNGYVEAEARDEPATARDCGRTHRWALPARLLTAREAQPEPSQSQSRAPSGGELVVAAVTAPYGLAWRPESCRY